jgi:hypothetical protein
MPTRLLIALTLILVAAPVALAQDPPPPAEPEACTADETTRRAMAALREALEDPMPSKAGRVIPVRVTPCGPGRLLLRVHHASTTGPLLATGERTLRSTRTATVRLRTTKEVERRRGKQLRLRLRASFTPAE